MTFAAVTPAQWRAQVEQELKGASYEKTLVTKTPEGLSIEPLYTEAPTTHHLAAGAPFKIAMLREGAPSAAELNEDLDNGADALWIDVGVLKHVQHRPAFFVLGGLLPSDAPKQLQFALVDGVAQARRVAAEYPNGLAAMVSTLADHSAGADAADELAVALSTGAAALEQLLGQGFTPGAAGKQVAFQLSVGRDTFAELAKVRALRVCWQKVLAAAKAEGARTLVHAVCATRTLTQNDPWVNMLRGTTQVFAAVLGGADLVTPLPFDRALGTTSALAQRVARNTGLVLREESSLGKVADPAAGSYYLETLTDQLAREAWRRFQLFEREGGVVTMRADGRLAARFDASWKARLADLARRKAPLLGVSEFANLDEQLPVPPRPVPELGRRDSEPYEALRAGAPRDVALVTMGSFAESRARVGFATNFFSAGGFKARETSEDPKGGVACLCGTDDRYAADAVARVKSLKANGVKKVFLAGRPGTLETVLRDAGIDGFVFLGCDVVATLTEVRA